MRMMLILAAAAGMAACAEEKKDLPPPPYAQPEIAEVLKAYRAEQNEWLKFKDVRRQKNFEAVQEKKRLKAEELGEPPPPPVTKTFKPFKLSKGQEVVAIKEMMCGWAPPEEKKFDDVGGTVKRYPPGGYYCDAKIVTAADKVERKRVFLFQQESKWVLYQVKNSFKTPLQDFAQLNAEDLAVLQQRAAEAEARKKAAAEKKKAEREARKKAGS